MTPEFYFRLEGREALPCGADEWARWFETADRTVARTTFPSGHWISTVFLGLNHALLWGGPPLIFETMAFDACGDTWDIIPMSRCSTWSEAEALHIAAVKAADALLKGGNHGR